MKKRDLFSIIYFSSLVLVALALGLLQDNLLFHSDIYSLVHYILTLTLALFVVLLGLYGLAAPILRTYLHGMMRRLPVVLILAGFVVYGIETFVYSFESKRLFALMLVGSFAASGLAMGRLSSKNVQIFARGLSLARVSTMAGLCGFALMTAYNHLVKPTFRVHEDPRHVVFLIIDTFPTKFLHSYVSERPETGFDRIAQRALFFPNARTSVTSTHGFHGALWAGTTRYTFGDAANEERERSLIGILQKQNIGTRYISFHNNGVPESNRIYGLDGLRSSFISEHLAWIPALIGLDYNVLTYKEGGRGLPMRPREEFVFKLLNRPFEQKDILGDYLIEEIKQIRRTADRSFLSFHTDHSLFLPDVWSEAKSKGVFKAIEDPKARGDAMQRVLLQAYEQRIKRVGEHLERFLERMAEEGLLDDSLVVITADHGILLERHRKGYALQPEEDVTRVPLVLIRKGHSGVDNRLLTTPDLTQTVLEYFQIDERLNEQARSLFNQPGRARVAVSTYPDNKKNEWWFLLYESELKYAFNIHRMGDGNSRKSRLSAFHDEILLEEGDVVRGDKAAWLRDALRSFGIPDDWRHEKFREAGLSADIQQEIQGIGQSKAVVDGSHASQRSLAE